jgi:hypothetical protein
MLEVFVTSIIVILLLLPIGNWKASSILYTVYKTAPNNIVLKDRFRLGLVLSLATTINAALASFALFHINSGSLFTVLLAMSLVATGIPNVVWLYLYYTNKLRK